MTDLAEHERLRDAFRAAQLELTLIGIELEKAAIEAHFRPDTAVEVALRYATQRAVVSARLDEWLGIGWSDPEQLKLWREAQ